MSAHTWGPSPPKPFSVFVRSKIISNVWYFLDLQGTQYIFYSGFNIYPHEKIIFTLLLPQYRVRGYRRHEQCDGWGTHDG